MPSAIPPPDRSHERQAPGARYLLYSHDSYGLGHLRRTLALAGAITRGDADADVLVLTGSTVATSYRLPERVDTVKLPVLSKDAQGDYHPLRLGVGFGAVRELRAGLALATAVAFRPDVLVVDKTPLGLRRELLPTLEHLVTTDTRLVLGLRDVEDSPDRVREEWGGRMRERIERFYDAVLVYGPPTSVDAFDVLGWDDLTVPLHHVGHVGPQLPSEGPPDLPDDYLLVTVGGGADGLAILETFLDAIRERPLGREAVVVTGPLMDDAALRSVARRAHGLPVRLHEFRADMEAVIVGARAVVAMAGYNTVAELLSAGKPALLVPRVRPRAEQLVRAQALQAAGLADVLHPADLEVTTMGAALRRLLVRPPSTGLATVVNGADAAAAVLADVIRTGQGARAA